MNETRGVRVKLDCGHESVISTSFYRLSAVRVACILNDAIRRGVWCNECQKFEQPVESLGTCQV